MAGARKPAPRPEGAPRLSRREALAKQYAELIAEMGTEVERAVDSSHAGKYAVAGEHLDQLATLAKRTAEVARKLDKG